MVCDADWFAMNEVDVSRIRLVTSRYDELRGLFAALLGCVMCLLAAAGSLQSPELLLAFLVMGGVIVILLGGYWLEERYYPSHFGRVHSSDQMRRYPWKTVVAVSVCSVVDSETLGKGLPATLPLFIGLQSLWLLFRDWPLRSHQGVVFAAGLLTSVLYTHANAQIKADWFITAGFLLGAAFIAAGMGDHRLLASTLDNPRAQLESSSDEQSV